MSSRRNAIIGTLLFVLLPLLALVLDGMAKRARAIPLADGRPARVILVANAGELWQTYSGLALRGRVLLHLGRHLHYVPVPVNELYTLDQGSVTGINLAKAYEQRVSHRNYLWIAAYAGAFRKIYYILNEADFRAKAEEAGVGSGEEFNVYDSGFPRVISLRPGATGRERPVVHIDAAWMESHRPEEVVALLRKLPVRPDVITLSTAEDAPDSPSIARERIATLKELIVNGRI